MGRVARAGRLIGALAAAAGCADSAVVWVEALPADVELRVVVRVEGGNRSVSVVDRDTPITGSLETTELWVVGYRRADLPWERLRDRPGQELARTLRPTLSGGTAAPPSDVVLHRAPGETGYLALDWDALGSAVRRIGGERLGFDPPLEEVCPLPGDVVIYSERDATAWYRAVLLEDCQLGIPPSVLHAPANYSSVCAGLLPDRVDPASGALVLRALNGDGPICPSAAAPLGAESAFACPECQLSCADDEFCRGGANRIVIQRRNEHLARLAPGHLPIPYGREHEVAAAPVEGGILIARREGDRHVFSVVTVGSGNAGVVERRSPVSWDRRGFGEVKLLTTDDSARVLVASSTTATALVGRLGEGGVEGLRPLSLGFPHGQAIASRDGARVFVASPEGLRVFDATTVAERARTTPSRADPRPELRRVFAVSSPEGPRIVSCVGLTPEHFSYTDFGNSRKLCDPEEVWLFDEDGRFVETFRGGPRRRAVLTGVYDGPELLYQLVYPASPPNALALVPTIEAHRPGESAPRFEAPIHGWNYEERTWSASGQGTLWVPRNAEVRHGDRRLLAVTVGYPIVLVDLGDGGRTLGPPGFAAVEILGSFAAGGKTYLAFQHIESYHAPPTVETGVYALEIPARR